MAKREITPHKGGRTERIGARIRPETKRRFEELAAAADMTVADLLEWWIQQGVLTMWKTIAEPGEGIEQGAMVKLPGAPFAVGRVSQMKYDAGRTVWRAVVEHRNDTDGLLTWNYTEFDAGQLRRVARRE